MARNRKRAKERRARQPQAVPLGSLEQRADAQSAGREGVADEPAASPDPIRHGTPDVELAEAQLALGRPELATGEAVVDEAELEAEAVEPDGAGAGGGRRGGSLTGGATGGGSGAAGLPAAPRGDAVAEPETPRVGTLARLINFLQGSWRELQRVQWPDRRQVMQATGVVIGFVIVAGMFLGVADWAAGKVMSFVLSGHF